MNIINGTDLLRDYESSKLVHYDSYGPDSENTYAFDKLGEDSEGGLPLVSRRIDGKLYTTFTGDTHVLVLGATRSGKTTGYIIPTIFLKAHQKRKDSMLITDPKGELYSKCAGMLREQGYKVVLVNFRDYRHSEFWNPLTPIFRKYRIAADCAKNVKTHKNKNGNYRYEFEGAVYETRAELDEALETRKQEILADVSMEIDNLAISIMPTLNMRDPYWEDSARQLFTAFLWAMLEDSEPSAQNMSPITEQTFSFRTILSILASFKTMRTEMEDNGYFSSRPDDSVARSLAKDTLLISAGTTRSCILSSFNTKLLFMRPAVSQVITSSNTFDIKELLSSDEPVAIFLIYRDEVKASYKLIQMFVTAAYTTLIEIANARENLTLPKPFYFILDEFGNLPQITDFENTISACGSRNIWFVLVIQSYAQLDRVYGNEVSAIIADNMNMRVFIGSNNAATKKKFSDECGVRTIITPLSALNGRGPRIDNYAKDVVPLIPVSKLMTLKCGECIVNRAGADHILWSMMERSYLCPEFDCEKANASEYVTSVPPFDKRTYYRRVSVYGGFVKNVRYGD